MDVKVWCVEKPLVEALLPCSHSFLHVPPFGILWVWSVPAIAATARPLVCAFTLSQPAMATCLTLHAQLARLQPHQTVTPDVHTCFQQPVQVLCVIQPFSWITPASQTPSTDSWQHHCLPAVSQQHSLPHRWAPNPSLQASHRLWAPWSQH